MKSKISTTKADPDLAQWCAALAQITAPADIVPPGWQTAQQIATRTKVPLATLQQKLKRLVASGHAERKMFCVRLAKQTRPVPHYRLL
jgi:predicted transcriptional regulator